jgi:hypothetical protein
MNKTTLFVGAAVMVICGSIFQLESFVGMGTGLMWMGIANDREGK